MFQNFTKKILDVYFSEQSRWVHWLPVGLIFGISAYFCLHDEPKIYIYIFLAFIIVLSLILIYKQPHHKFISYIIIGFCLGFYTIGLHVSFNSTVMFNNTQYNKNITGHIDSIENHPCKDDGSSRIILDCVKINNSPYSAKLRLNAPNEIIENFQINDEITITGKIYPIPMPSSLYGYFARRAAFLQKIGGTINLKKLLKHEKSKTNSLKQIRLSLTQKLLSNLSSPYGSIASALVTGDRSYIPKELRQSFINAGLAHILAISGLHLSIIAGLIFLLLRRCICLVPVSSIYFSTKKISACLAILATMLYMAIANFGIPVQRSFLMITLAMLAICLDRTALSMRSLAIAAFIVLIISPESALSASFQLSFIAVLGLLAFYESAWFSFREKIFKNTSNFLGIKKILFTLFGILATTFIASLITTPYSIAFFQRFTAQAILGNLLAIPLISLVVMPLGLFSILSLLFSKNSIFFWFWGKSLKLLCIVAEKVASLPGASIQVKAVPSYSLFIFSIGVLWICIWKKLWRWLGLIPAILSILFWRFFELPTAYINAKNDVMAYQDKDAMYISDFPKNTFTANIWVQEWGVSQIETWKHSFYLLDRNTLLITSPKEGIEYLHENSNTPEISTIFTFGYEKTLRKHGFEIQRIIDRNIIQHEEGIAIYTNPLRICFLKSFFGSRPWCTNY